MGGTYSNLFHELFKPTKIVMDEILKYRKILGNSYISITARFQNLLGDFEEQNIVPLKDAEKEKLISKCLDKIEELHLEQPDKNVLVTADSYTFLCRAKQLDYVTVIEGKVKHMDWSEDKSIEIYKKSFVDYLMISEAKQICQISTGRMYRSYFPAAASHVNNRPYKLIEF